MSSIRSIRVLCAAYFCFVLLGLCAATMPSVTSVTRKGDILVMRGLFGDSLSDESKLSVNLESPTPFSGSGCISVKVSKTLIACTLQAPLATATTIKVTVSYDGVVLGNADHRSISFYNSLARERDVQCTGDEQALTFEAFADGEAIQDNYGGLVWDNMYAFDTQTPAHKVNNQGDEYTNFFNGIHSGQIVAYNHETNGLTATWRSKTGWLFSWHAWLTAAYHAGTTYDIYGYVRGEQVTHQHIILGDQPHYPNVTGPADTWTVVLRAATCPPGGAQCELVMDDFSLTCVSFRDPVISVPVLVRGEEYNTYDVTLTNLNAINYHITANSDCFFSDGTDYMSTLTFAVAPSEVNSKTIQMYCTKSQASVTATLSVGTASWTSNQYRVYVPTISHIGTQWHHVCSPQVTISDIYAGMAVPVSYVGDTNADCQFYRSSVNGVCTDAITSADTATGDSYSFYMSCSRTQLQRIDIGGFESNNFQVKQNDTNGGHICGDPYFNGYDGRTFTFSGHPNRWYNVFSNQYVSVNSYFIPTHGVGNKNNESTVNGAVAIRTREFNISTQASMYHPEDNKVTIMVNGEKKIVQAGKVVVLGDGCIKIQLRKSANSQTKIQHTLSIHSREFEVFVYMVQDHNAHIDAQYFDYYVSADLSNPEALGGILGATARKYDIEKLKHNARTFQASSDFAADAKTDKFEDVAICEEFHKRKQIATPCHQLETGFRCTGDRGCISGRCSTRKTCEDPDLCFSDAECVAINKFVAGEWVCLPTGRCFNNAGDDDTPVPVGGGDQLPDKRNN